MKIGYAALTTLALPLALAGCGSNQPTATAADGAVAQPGQSLQQRSRPPGASGEVAAVDGHTLQVQNPVEGQVAVTWTAKTAFTRQVDAAFADVAVGDCVVVAAPSSPDSTSGRVTAGSVRISSAVGGECVGSGGPGGLGGPVGAGAPMSQPSEAPMSPPSGAPSGAPDGQLHVEGPAAVGKVTAVSGSGFTVAAQPLPRPGQTATATTSSVVVAVTAHTTYTTMGRATSAAATVGTCVDARGTQDATGAITATSIAVTPKVDGQCGGFGRPVLNRTGS